MRSLYVALIAALISAVAAAGALACWSNSTLIHALIWFVVIALLGAVVGAVALVIFITRRR
jgi:hypothetical protein